MAESWIADHPEAVEQFQARARYRSTGQPYVPPDQVGHAPPEEDETAKPEALPLERFCGIGRIAQWFSAPAAISTENFRVNVVHRFDLLSIDDEQIAHRVANAMNAFCQRESLTFRFSCESGMQRIMRHSSITLTMDTYGHLFPGEEAETVDHLPDMTVKPVDPVKATGTCDYLSGDRHVLALRLAQKERFKQTDKGACGRITQSRERSEIRRKSSVSDVFDGRTRRSNNEGRGPAAYPSGLRERIANPLA